jgi:GTP-binding protein LepA
LAAVIERIPPPKGNVDEPLQALIFDSTIHFVELKCDKRRNWAKRLSLWLLVMNISQMKLDLKLNQVPKKVISTGDGYLISGIKEARRKVGDTVTDAKNTNNHG